MNSCLILRATLVGILLLGLLTPAQTKAGYLGSYQGMKKQGYLGSVKRGCQRIKPWGCIGRYQGMKKQGYLGSVKRGYNYQGMKKQAAPERKDHLWGMGSP